MSDGFQLTSATHMDEDEVDLQELKVRIRNLILKARKGKSKPWQLEALEELGFGLFILNFEERVISLTLNHEVAIEFILQNSNSKTK